VTSMPTSTNAAHHDHEVSVLGKADESELTQRFCDALHKRHNLGQVILAIDNFVTVMEAQCRRGRHGMARSDQQEG
jgi:hypothetical protein